MTEPVENWSYTSRNVRVHIKVGVAYDSDLALAQWLMIEAASASPRVLDKPKPSVWLLEFADSSIDHEILCWIADPEGRGQCALRRAQPAVGAVQGERHRNPLPAARGAHSD